MYTFEDTLASVAEVQGWMTDDQARRLWDRAAEVPADGQIVEIGSFRGRSMVVLARSATPGASLVAIDPHAGNDRGPQQISGMDEEAEVDNRVFHANLERAGVSDRVRHLREFSDAAHDGVEGPIDLLYVDGAHRFGPARADIRDWGARVRDGGVMLIHDSFSSVGVTLALIAELFRSPDWRYEGRSQSMTQYRRVAVPASERRANLVAQVRELPWFVANVIRKVLILLRLRKGPWPY